MLTALIGPVSNLLGKFIEDKDMKNKLAHEVATMAESHGGLRSFEKYKGLTK